MVLKLPLALRRQNNLWNSVPTTLLQTIRIYSFKTRKSCTKVLYVDEQSFKLALSLGQDRHATPTPLFCPFGLRCCPHWIYCFCVARTPRAPEMTARRRHVFAHTIAPYLRARTFATSQRASSRARCHYDTKTNWWVAFCAHCISNRKTITYSRRTEYRVRATLPLYVGWRRLARWVLYMDTRFAYLRVLEMSVRLECALPPTKTYVHYTFIMGSLRGAWNACCGAQIANRHSRAATFKTVPRIPFYIYILIAIQGNIVCRSWNNV